MAAVGLKGRGNWHSVNSNFRLFADRHFDATGLSPVFPAIVGNHGFGFSVADHLLDPVLGHALGHNIISRRLSPTLRELLVVFVMADVRLPPQVQLNPSAPGPWK